MTAPSLLQQVWSALGGETGACDDVGIIGAGDLPSVFAVSDLAAASVGAAALAAADLIAVRHGARPKVSVDRRLASLWFGFSIKPEGWVLPPSWDPIADDYAVKDGWIRLHTNAAHHRAAVLTVLGATDDKNAVARAAAAWTARDLESAIVAAGGCAAEMRAIDAWRAHEQGRAVAAEPLVDVARTEVGSRPSWAVPRARPLSGVKVLDLTRVLAGPAASRFLAGLGATVLRIDPPWWEERANAPEMTLGKRCARLDLREDAARARLESLLLSADVLVHGYRSDALERLGLGAPRRREIRPGLIDVALDAYGWSGPWHARRGYDSLVQMSSGIADAGMRRLNKDRPTPLPVQALDHATGYLLAAAALNGLAERLRSGRGTSARASLARTAALLIDHPADWDSRPFAPRAAGDDHDAIERTDWGPARRLKPPVVIDGAALKWDSPACRLGTAPTAW